MPKRFAATEKWDDPWYSNLSPTNRNFWDYICAKCDHAGVWQVNFQLVKFYFGSDFNFDDSVFGDRIIKFSPERWFIPKFILFQYRELNEAVSAQRSALAILKKYGLVKHLPKSYRIVTKELAKT